MLFNSIDFLLFFVVVFGLFILIPLKYRWILLLISSYFFYMSWEPAYILLIVFSTVVDYSIAQKMFATQEKAKRKRLLLVSLVVNLGLLFIFKYYNFFNESIASTFDFLGITYNPVLSSMLLPVGISFYTFQTLSYTIDVYRGNLKPEKHFGKFALYVSFFPQLVAGPIERATNLLPQIAKNDKRLNYNDFSIGLTQTLFGLFKKVVVADTVAIYVNTIFNSYEYHTGFTLVLATYFFAVQIYCDFSGYSDMAIGVARMMGFNLMENFNLPYFSKNVTEFWRRWHISLSSWLRDYLYIPLGGNRNGQFNTYKNLMITMLLGGLWHGASWNFVIWGALNGAYLSIERVIDIKQYNFNKNFLTKAGSSFITFNLICLTWIFFRSQDFEESYYIINEIFNSRDFFNLKILDISVFINALFGVIVLFFFDYFFLRNQKISFWVLDKPVYWTIGLNTVFILLILLFGVSEGSQFIYFQF